MSSKKSIKLDQINRKIITIVHTQSDISNQELSERVGLSNSACFQRTKALKEAGYFIGFHTDLDLNRIAKNVLAYVEFTLESNNPKARKIFEDAINARPEFMDCLRITGDVDYICFTCCSDTQALNALCDTVNGNSKLGIQKVKTRIILERSKWYLGYPLQKLEWLD
ncbi:Lrp/AsnC family transcriptional regulator [uncultured Paraglaciecola sp.]|uniref:Lrp/AsnC family transcriptional regulator n=1 Tax=uncultured Paraglaciecola sp. TaxID=1765024 RepID=UPI0030DB1365|tara:strand:- start:42698 stop:43198 length:501 start_codon:yes stop_codon:yes gene_type:complete